MYKIPLTIVFGICHFASLICSSNQNSSDNDEIQFPMLALTDYSGVKITNRANVGYTVVAQKHKHKSHGSNKFLRTHDDMVEVNTPTTTTTQAPQLGYFSNDIDAELQEPPPYYETAKMARYVVANSNWTSMSTISSRDPTVGFPFSSVVSVSDGALEKSTGIPYFYVTPLDLTVRDLQVDNRASLSMTLAQEDYCTRKQYDVEDPRCARVMLTGKITKIVPGSPEEKLAQEALFSRHPEMKDWPKDHGFFCAKMNIINIVLLDYFGGAKTIPTEDYFKASPY